jgi:hypothetical protein
VVFGGRWQRPDAVAERIKADAARAEALARYRDKRAKTPATAEAQWKLALWCEENGLREEARAHLVAVTRLDPSREAAWKRLGYRKHGPRWVTDAQLTAERAEADAQKQADQRWKPRLEKWRAGLAEKAKRAAAEDGLATVTDPRAVPMVWSVFAVGDAGRQKVAVRVLGQIDAPSASRGLAVLAVFSRLAEVRRLAAETLRGRDARDFAALLVGWLRDPIEYEVKPVGGPASPGSLFVSGKKLNVKRLYSLPTVFQFQPGDQLDVDAAGNPIVRRSLGNYWVPLPMGLSSPAEVAALVGPPPIRPAQEHAIAANFEHLGASASQSRQIAHALASASTAPTNRPVGHNIMTSVLIPEQAVMSVDQMISETQRSTQAAADQLARDVEAIERYNAPILAVNERTIEILKTVSKQDLGNDRESWKLWATDLLGYALSPQKASGDKPTVIEQAPITFQPQALPLVLDGAPVAAAGIEHSCFGAGTPVRTLDGVRPVETLRAGDQVLTQNTNTGALSYQPIVAVYHNPPNETLRIRLGDESVVATGIHRFWKVGRGWTMARELKPGDVVRRIGGVSKVTAVETDRVQRVFNLEVAHGASFFVGQAALLVHDNSLVQPVTEPFDAAPALDAIASSP